MFIFWLIMQCGIFIFFSNIKIVEAAACPEINASIEAQKGYMQQNYVLYQQALAHIALSDSQQAQIDTLKQNANAELQLQKQKNEASIRYYIEHYPKLPDSSKWNPNVPSPLEMWKIGKDKVASDGDKKLKEMQDMYAKQISDLEMKLDSDYSIAKTAEYNKADVSDKQTIDNLTAMLKSCGMQENVEETAPAKENPAKTVVAINAHSSIINASTSTNIMPLSPHLIITSPSPEQKNAPKISLWKKFITFIKKIF